MKRRTSNCNKMTKVVGFVWFNATAAYYCAFLGGPMGCVYEELVFVVSVTPLLPLCHVSASCENQAIQYIADFQFCHSRIAPRDTG